MSTAELTKPTKTKSLDRPRTETAFWISLALFGLVIFGCAVASAYYTDILVAPYVGP